MRRRSNVLLRSLGLGRRHFLIGGGRVGVDELAPAPSDTAAEFTTAVATREADGLGDTLGTKILVSVKD